MNIAEIRKMNSEELAKALREKREKLQDLQFKVSMEEHAQVSDVSKIKKDIARLLTVQREQQLAQ